MLKYSRKITLYIFLFNLICHAIVFGIISSDPRIVYLDGRHRWDTCVPGMKRTASGESGLLISHDLYGTMPYNASKNCFLMVTVPIGYRIRLRVLDFNVLGDSKNCTKDTLHIFDHETSIDPNRMDDIPEDRRTPGRILGQFCGNLKNITDIAVSSHNALTLWWHTNHALPQNHEGEGFRILWSSYRVSDNRPCMKDSEFQCLNGECIPLSLACNAYADCQDKSDLDRNRQLEYKCEHIPDDVFSTLTGPKKLLICLAVVLCCICICFCGCACFFFSRNTGKLKKAAASSRQSSETKTLCTTSDQPISNGHPMPPKFSPPQIPTTQPPTTPMIGAYSPHRSQNIGYSYPQNYPPYPPNQLGYPPPQHLLQTQASTSTSSSNNTGVTGLPPNGASHLTTTTHLERPHIVATAPSDYTYVRNEATHRLLL